MQLYIYFSKNIHYKNYHDPQERRLPTLPNPTQPPTICTYDRSKYIWPEIYTWPMTYTYNKTSESDQYANVDIRRKRKGWS